jgi:ubiquinol-cytochrome c reductase cytochrome c1 subunit
MAAGLRAICHRLISTTFQAKNSAVSTSTHKRSLRFLSGVAAAGFGSGLLITTFIADEDALHPPKFPWSHNGPFSALDHRSIRRGYQVYKEVCSACHGMEQLAFRNLVGVSHTEDEARALAEEVSGCFDKLMSNLFHLTFSMNILVNQMKKGILPLGLGN